MSDRFPADKLAQELFSKLIIDLEKFEEEEELYRREMFFAMFNSDDEEVDIIEHKEEEKEENNRKRKRCDDSEENVFDKEEIAKTAECLASLARYGSLYPTETDDNKSDHENDEIIAENQLLMENLLEKLRRMINFIPPTTKRIKME
jgi:hypothetical protein